MQLDPDNEPPALHLSARTYIDEALRTVLDRQRAAVASDAGVTVLGPVELQVLFWLKTQPPLTQASMTSTLEQWPGTGRLKAHPLVDIVADAALYVRSLVARDLLWEMGAPTRRLLVSPRGIAILNGLHPAWEDSDLPNRIALWADEWPASKVSIDRYVSLLRLRGDTPVPLRAR
ncbi:hypothetical protein ACSFA0_25230 [Variovorax sp. LT1P1]|uniref:hypothetical protein n=1 Tax=Variovorax sp. LT1P1 TaxID=3443730 RepID=UPI003F44C264